MTKQEIIEKFILKLNEVLAEYELSWKRAEGERKDAPGPMESHSDTTRSQKENEAGYFLTKIAETKEVIDYLNGLKSDREPGGIRLGDIVKSQNIESDKISYYLIIEKIGGVKLEDISAIIISSTTPIAKALIGKNIDDFVSLEIAGNLMKIKILDIL